MRTLITGLLLCCCSAIFAQQVSLPKKISSLADVEGQMPELASRVLKLYQVTDPAELYDISVRLQMAAGLYPEALRSIDSIQQLFGISSDSSVTATFFHYRCFALAKLMPLLPHTDFEKQFTEILSANYGQLPESAKPRAEQYFLQDSGSYVKELNRLIEDFRGKEQLEVRPAIQLIRNWYALYIIRWTQRPSKTFFAMEEEKKYILTDSLLLTRDRLGSIPILVARSKNITGPVPAVLMNNIYAGPSDRSAAKEAADRGYAGIIINTRGKRTSPNEVEPFEHDGEDINTVLDWLSKQSWFNGKAGMHGGSYLGFSQWAATKKLHPALKTIVPQVSVGFGIDFPRINGVYYTYMLRWLHYVTNNKLTDLPEFINDEKWDQLSIKWYTSGRSFRKLDSLEGRPMPLFQRWLDHPEFDSYWRSILPVDHDFRQIKIPVLTTTGYFDDDQPGALHYYTEHLKWNPQAEHYLFIGPYDHLGAQSSPSDVVLGYTIDSVARISVNQLMWEWMDHILRGAARPKSLMGKITYQPMGTNQWKGAVDMKSISNSTLNLYLGHQYTSRGFLLQTVKPFRADWLEQVIDLKGRPIVNFRIQARAATTPPVRENIVFMSEPLPQDLQMNGLMTGKVEVVLNKKDADLLFELYELTSDSAYHLLSYTYQRLSYVLNPGKRTLLIPGKAYQIPVYNSSFTSRRIARGSRLVLYAGPVKDFNFQVNYGSGKPVSEESIADAGEPLRIRWSNQSFIQLPLLK